jgi:uncharacterized membrane protein YgaE (UPF0421/DUF939 family)
MSNLIVLILFMASTMILLFLFMATMIGLTTDTYFLFILVFLGIVIAIVVGCLLPFHKCWTIRIIVELDDYRVLKITWSKRLRQIIQIAHTF